MKAFLEAHSVTIKKVRTKGDKTYLDLTECPIAGSAGGTSVSVIVETTGRIIYKNQHNGGAGNTWIDLREQIEPGYREYVKGEKEKFAATDAPPPEPWDDPIPLTGAAILPEFPVEHLPCLVRTFVTSVAGSRQAPVDLPGALALGVVAAGVARKFKVQIGETHADPTNIYICAAMKTGERKSPVFTDMAEPLEAYEREMVDSMRSELIQKAERRKIQEHRLEALRKRAARPDNKEAARDQQQAEDLAIAMEEVPLPPRYIARDSTPEALSQVLANNGGKITVLQPEGGGLFDILAGRYSGTANFDVWLHGNTEEDLRIDRKGSGTVFVPRASINAVLTTQPEVIEKLSSIEGGRGRGLLGRFLYSMPKSNVGYRPYKNTPIDPKAREDYRTLVRAVLSIPDPMKGDLGEPAAPYMLHVEGDALEIYRKLHDQIEEEMREGGPLAGIADFANKLPGSAARLAGILHVAEHACHAADFVINVMGAGRSKKKVLPTTIVGICKCDGKPEKVQISPATMVSAWSLALYFLEHAKAAFGMMAAPEGMPLALRILKWIQRRGEETFTKHEVQRGVQPDRVADLDQPLALLEEHGYIRRLPPRARTGKVGRPVTDEWEVNPAILHDKNDGMHP